MSVDRVFFEVRAEWKWSNHAPPDRREWPFDDEDSARAFAERKERELHPAGGCWLVRVQETSLPFKTADQFSRPDSGSK